MKKVIFFSKVTYLLEFYLYKIDDRKAEAPKRLSTPMKDFDANRAFNRKKFMNL